jgi:hypothetical protein
MPDQELVDGLVQTYRTLNMTVRPLPEAKLSGAGADGASIHDLIVRLRDDELRFSQALKARVSTGQAMPDASQEELAVIGTESVDDMTAEIIAQFGTARESTLAMLRGLAEPEWDTAGAGGRTIRIIIGDLLAKDRQRLGSISALLGRR